MPSRRSFDDRTDGMAISVVIGVDPAKRFNTIEVIDSKETTLSVKKFDNTTAGYQSMRAAARRWPKRIWAVEGATGVGLHLAQRLVSDGERVVDVPAKLSTRVRAIDTGHRRKNDPTDAHAVAVVGLRTPNLREVTVDDQMVALRLLTDRRRDLTRSRTQAVNRLHQVLMDLIASGVPPRCADKSRKPSDRLRARRNPWHLRTPSTPPKTASVACCCAEAAGWAPQR